MVLLDRPEAISMVFKILGLGASGLLGLGVLGMMPAVAHQDPASPPSQKTGRPDSEKDGEARGKKDAEGAPEADLQRAYSLLRRLRAETPATARADARIREWTERATKYYGDGVRAYREQNPQLARQYAAIARELARAVDHTRNSALFDRPDESLPPPPASAGSGREAYSHRELMRAYEQFRSSDDGSDAGPEAKYFREAAASLYEAARRDFEAGHVERAGELARAAEAMTLVCEHLGKAADLRVAPSPDAATKPRGRSGREGDRGKITTPPDRP
jgi:hypothetical protein